MALCDVVRAGLVEEHCGIGVMRKRLTSDGMIAAESLDVSAADVDRLHAFGLT